MVAGSWGVGAVRRLVAAASVVVLLLVVSVPGSGAVAGAGAVDGPGAAGGGAAGLAGDEDGGEDGGGFSDVPAGHTFAADVAWLASTGITQGRDDGTFGLNDAVTRGAMAAFLFRYEGEPEGPFDASEFPDVPQDHVFAEPIAWLAETGVTEGRDDGTFGLNDPVTRGAMAAFLHRYDREPDGPFDAPEFPDVPEGQVFAEPIAWLAASGVTEGRDDGTFGLNDAVTRGAMAAFLFRYDRQVAGSEAELRVVERLPGARLGLSYAAGLEAAGGVGPYRWEVSGLPEGLAADAEGRIRGVAVDAGSWTVVVEVTDQRGERAAGEVVLEVDDIGVPAECVGQDCAVLEPFDGSEVEIGDTTVDRTTFELEPGQVEAMTVDAPGQHEDDAVDVVEPGGVDGFAELRVFDLAEVPQLGDVLVVAASDHPPGHLGTLIVQAEQVEEVGDGTVEVAGVVVGLPSAYHSGVVHVRDGDGGEAGLAGLAGSAGSGVAQLAEDAAAPVTCELDSGQEVSAEAAPWTDGDVYVEWRLGVPREVEVLLEAGIDVGAELEVSGELSCELSSLPAVTVPKGPVFFRLAPALTFEADGAVQGSLSASASCEAMFGYNRDEDASFDCTGDSEEVGLFDDLDADADARAQASLTAELEPSITMVQVVGITGSLGAAISAHLTPLDQPRARIDLTAPTELGGCLGCDLPVAGTLVEDTFVEHTYGPTTIWALGVDEPDEDGVQIAVPDGWDTPKTAFPDALWTYANDVGININSLADRTVLLDGGDVVVGPRSTSPVRVFELDVVAPDGGVGFRVPQPLAEGAVWPHIAVAGPDGDVLIEGSDGDGRRVMRLTPDGKVVWSQPMEWPQDRSPRGMVLTPDDRLYMGYGDGFRGSHQVIDAQTGALLEGSPVGDSKVRWDNTVVADDGVITPTDGAVMRIGALRFDDGASTWVDYPEGRGGNARSAVDADGTTYAVAQVERDGCQLVLDRIDVDWAGPTLRVTEDLWSVEVSTGRCTHHVDWVVPDPDGGVVVGWSMPNDEVLYITRVAPDGSERSEATLERVPRRNSDAAMAANGTVYVLFQVLREPTSSDECGNSTCRDPRIVAVSPDGSIETVLSGTVAPYTWSRGSVMLGEDRIYVSGEYSWPRQTMVAAIEHPGVAPLDPRRSR